MSRYYTLVQGKRTGLRSNKLAAPSDAKLVFCVFFSSARLLKKRPYAIDTMHRSLRVAILSPPPPPPAKVKRKRRNVYENPNRTLLIVFCDDTINYAILCHLMIFFSSVKGNG